MTRTEEMKDKLQAARYCWAHGQTDDALEKVMDVLDLLVSERSQAEKAADRQRQIDEALMSLSGTNCN